MEQTQRRPRRKTLTDHMVADLVRKRKVGFTPDPETPKFGVRIRPSGVAAYYIITRDKQSKLQKWVKVASVGDMTIEAARDLAKPMIKRVEAGLPPVEPPPVQPDSVADVVENFLKRHVQKNNLRTADEVERVLRRLRPANLERQGVRDAQKVRHRRAARHHRRRVRRVNG
jgi:hypothetical protein